MALELTDKNYNKLLDNDKVIFVDFYSPSCGPCQGLLKMLPAIEEFAEKEGALVYKVNVATNPKIASHYMIQSVPMTLIITPDKSIKDAELGLKDLSYYIGVIKKHTSPSFFQKIFS